MSVDTTQSTQVKPKTSITEFRKEVEELYSELLDPLATEERRKYRAYAFGCCLVLTALSLFSVCFPNITEAVLESVIATSLFAALTIHLCIKGAKVTGALMTNLSDRNIEIQLMKARLAGYTKTDHKTGLLAFALRSERRQIYKRLIGEACSTR